MSSALTAKVLTKETTSLDSLRKLIAQLQGVEFLAMIGQLILLCVVVDAFSLGSVAFARLLKLVAGGFVIHYFLPRPYRLCFFVGLSLAGVLLILGWRDALCLIAAGGALITICRLPLPPLARRIMLLAAGGLLLLMGIYQAPSWLGAAVVPLLGSMFMFRMLIYQYDVKHGAPKDLTRTLAYFFLLPNVAFPLFPVVDYKTFCSTYYNDQPTRIYQKGLKWILRGLIQLLLYRLVYQMFIIDPERVVGAFDAFRFMTTTYLLYLQVSGSFHLIVGILALFGFNLPETHHLYFLSSSFTDFWRRINVYWKNFMLKLFFYPAYTRFKSLGAVGAMIVATIFTFVVTWALHSYQWLWLRGSFPLTIQDAIFWPALAVLVLANSLIETRWGRRRSLGPSRFRGWPALSVALRTIGVFVVICTLWSLWSCSSLQEWWTIVACFAKTTWTEAAVIAACLVGVGVAAVLWGHSTSEQTLTGTRVKQDDGKFPFARQAAGVVMLAGGICVVGSSDVYDWFPQRVSDFIVQLKRNELNRADSERMTRGYYEDLTNVSRYNSQLSERYAARPKQWKSLVETPELISSDPAVGLVLKPNVQGQLLGQAFTANRWALRDRDYAKEKPPGTYRIALVGNSNSMGRGVADGETYEQIAEDQLNLSKSRGPYQRIEILNFSLSGRNLTSKLLVVEQQVFEFQPDAVFYVTHGSEVMFTTEFLWAVPQGKAHPHFDIVSRYVAESGVTANSSRAAAIRKLHPYAPQLMQWVWQRFARSCQKRNVEPCLLYLPLPDSRTEKHQQLADEMIGWGRQLDMTVFDLRGAFADDLDQQQIVLAPWDKHLNPHGHRLVANRLVELLGPHLEQAAPRNADRNRRPPTVR